MARRLIVTLTFVPLFMFVLGLVIGVLASEDPLEVG